MASREPRDIEQCIGCGESVAVYSSKQLVDGEPYCPRCRRIHREHKKPKTCKHRWEPEGRQLRCSWCGATREPVRHNPLDPLAYDEEGHPFSPKNSPVSREQQLGVHATPLEEVAVCYAIQRASGEVTILDEGDPPNCGVVFELNVTGLEPLPDVDAAITAGQNVDALTGLLDHPVVGQALWAGDGEALLDAVAEEAENFEFADGYGWPPDTYIEAAWREITQQHSFGIIRLLSELSPEDLLRNLEIAREEGNVPLELWMEVVEQHRYMSRIGIGRLRSVQLVRPVRWKLWGQSEDDEELGFNDSPDYPPEDLEGPQVFAWPEDFAAGEIAKPDMEKVFGQHTRGVDFEYHGTDLTRARSIFPELEGVLRSRWPYTQE